jgi:hypothetical protein
MTRNSMRAAIFATLLFCSLGCWSQVATGNPVFGSPQGGIFDTLNLGNLNVHFSIPVVHKAGRGMPFSYDLSFDSSVWSPVGVSGNQVWTPVSNWGWLGITDAAVGTLTNSSIVIGCDPGSGRFIYYYDYHDPAGTVHRFPMPNGAYNTCDDGPVTVQLQTDQDTRCTYRLIFSRQSQPCTTAMAA